MPGMPMSPGMMQCCPVGNAGMAPLMNPAAYGPPQFRSFHSNLATARFRNPQPYGGISGLTGFQQAMPVAMNACCPQPAVAIQPVCQQVCQPVPVSVPAQSAYIPAPVYSYQPPTVPSQPWTLPSLPSLSWKWPKFPNFRSQKVEQTVSQNWVPIVNDQYLSSYPVVSEGCGSQGSEFHFSDAGCGEDIPYMAMPVQSVQSRPAASLSPAAVPPSDADIRYFPNTGKQKDVSASDDEDTYYFDPPPAAEVLPEPSEIKKQSFDPSDGPPMIAPMMDPPTARDAVSPASKPAMGDAINPFEDVEDSEPEASLPIEAEMPQAILRIPAAPNQPLYIPNLKPAANVVQTVAATLDPPARVQGWSIEALPVSNLHESRPAAVVQQATPFLQPVAYQEVSNDVVSVETSQSVPRMAWQSIELKQAFFADEEQQQNQYEAAAKSQVQRSRVSRSAVVRRSAVHEAEQLVPVRRVVSRRKQ